MKSSGVIILIKLFSSMFTWWYLNFRYLEDEIRNFVKFLKAFLV